jgi:hypothetical protein
MTLKQISIFLENSPGRLLEITTAFGDAGINLRALCLAGTSGFGILRLIVSDLHKARNIAMEHMWPARVDEVVAVRHPDKPGSLAKLLVPLNAERIDMEYMYALSGLSAGEAVLIFGFEDVEKAAAVLKSCGAVLIGIDEFEALENQEK